MSKQALMELIKQKDEMQKTLAKLTEQIEQIEKIKHFDRGLTDKEGFPREDLDFGELANYRNLKRRKAQLNNDHVKLMKEIEGKLFEFHQTLPKVAVEEQEVKPNFDKVKSQQKPSTKPQMKAQQVIEKVDMNKYVIEYLTPFAKISLVEPNSPASMGGLRVNDLLSEFASVMIYTPDNIKQIPTFVQEGHSIKIVVMRPVDENSQEKYEKLFALKDGKSYAKVELNIVPQKWSGRGLLGCKIDPL